MADELTPVAARSVAGEAELLAWVLAAPDLAPLGTLLPTDWYGELHGEVYAARRWQLRAAPEHQLVDRLRRKSREDLIRVVERVSRLEHPADPADVARRIVARSVLRGLVAVNTAELRGLGGAAELGLPARSGARAVCAAAAAARAVLLARVNTGEAA